jgi:hypothetical protein
MSVTQVQTIGITDGSVTPAKLSTGSPSWTTGGVLSVIDDIIAFASDERLKTNIQPLENAIDKVLTLDGFTYNFNEIGQSLGFDGKITHVGVSAQQVQAVLPEAVALCPANNDYLTVKYEKLVPLLIVAIKELKKEINELKAEIGGLGGIV